MPTKDEIRSARIGAELTQQQAAALLGVGRVTWTRYELGTRHMTETAWLYWLHVAGIQKLPAP